MMSSASRITFIEHLIHVIFACPRSYREQHAAHVSVLVAGCGVTLPPLGDRRRAALPLILCDTAREWEVTADMRAAWKAFSAALPTPIRRHYTDALTVLHTALHTTPPLKNTKTFRDDYHVDIRGQGRSRTNLYEAAEIARVRPATLQWHLSRRGRFQTVLDVDMGAEDITITRVSS